MVLNVQKILYQEVEIIFIFFTLPLIEFSNISSVSQIFIDSNKQLIFQFRMSWIQFHTYLWRYRGASHISDISDIIIYIASFGIIIIVLL